MKRRRSEREPEYEQVPRRRRLWTREARKQTRLPIVASTGETLAPAPGDERTTAESPVTAAGGVVIALSKKKRQKLEKTQKELLRKEAACALRKQTQKKIAACGGLRNFKQAQEVERALSRMGSREQKLQEIVRLSELMIAEPESNLYLMEVLFRLVESDEQSASEPHNEMRSLALISIAAIMKNIIPAYRVGERTHVADTQVSKAVEKQRSYEATLLAFYERLVKTLKARAQKEPNVVSAVTSELLAASPNFNFADDLLRLLVRFACWPTDKGGDQARCGAGLPSVADGASRALLLLIQNDPRLDVAVRAARFVGAATKASLRNPGGDRMISGSLFRILSEIDFAARESAVLRDAELRGVRTGEKFSKEVLRDLSVSSIYGDIRRFKQNQTEILRELFVSFLRVLRGSVSFAAETVQGALEALARLSHLVNVELMTEIFEELRKVVEQGRCPTVVDELAAIRAVVCLGRGPGGAALKVDLYWVFDAFCRALDGCLPFLLPNSSAASSIVFLPFKHLRSPPSMAGLRSPRSGEASSRLSQFQQPLPELHAADCSDFASRIVESAQLVLECCQGDVHAAEDIVRLSEKLLNLSCQAADPVCRLLLLSLVSRHFLLEALRSQGLRKRPTYCCLATTVVRLLLPQVADIVKKRPDVSSAFDNEGIVFYGTGEKSMTWTVRLLSHYCGEASATPMLARSFLQAPA